MLSVSLTPKASPFQGIPDYLAGRGAANNESLAATLRELCEEQFGAVDTVKGRFKLPFADGSRKDEPVSAAAPLASSSEALKKRLRQWMGQSWGLVTFVQLAAATRAKEEGLSVPVSAEPDAREGFLQLKAIDMNLANSSPLGQQKTEREIALITNALVSCRHPHLAHPTLLFLSGAA